jgi:hypothetical protein
MIIGFPFGAGALSSLNRGFGDLEIWCSRFRRKKPAPFVYERSTAISPLGFGKAPIEGPLVAQSGRPVNW